jgi:hypothetical protein
MSDMKKSFILLLCIVGALEVAFAQVPKTISYQGFYTDASGNPVNGAPHKVTFRFFDAVTNAENSSLAREVENLTINKGIISVTIGGGDPSHTTGPDNAALPLDVWTQAYKIQVSVDGNSIGDQVPLTTVPYAFVAGSVDGANLTGTLAASKISGTVAGTQIGTGINASNITTGILNPSLFTDGSIPGTKLALDINATNIASGTLADSRLESTLDVTGVNTSGNITTAGGVHVGGTSDPGADNLVVDGTISGNGSGITAINANNISTGTISDSRLETTLDVAGVNTSGNITTAGGVHVGGTSDPGADNLVVDGTITGNGSGISLLNATNISSGTIPDARLETNVDVSGFVTTVGGVHVGGTSDPGAENLVVDGTITGVGSGITNLNASNLASGTIPNTRFATTVDITALNVGTAGPFAVTSSGNISKIKNLSYEFPSSHNSGATFLSNNGSGSLSWSNSIPGSYVGTGINAANLTGTNTLPNSVLDVDVVDLADGTLSNTRLETTIDRTIFNATDYITAAGGINVGSSADPNGNLLVTSGMLIVGNPTPTSFSLDIKSPLSATTAVVRIDKTAAAGSSIVDIYRAGFIVGNITEASGTVSYNSFTGSHLASCADSLVIGSLVSMTGRTQRTSRSADSEPVYDVILCSTENDPRILGTFLHDNETTAYQNKVTGKLRTIMAVGNGSLWVAEMGSDLKVGDYLISSSIPGHAIKDYHQSGVSYVIARAAESIEWDKVSEVFEGKRHAKISVLFENFIINHDAENAKTELTKVQHQLNNLQERIKSLESLFQAMTRD